MTSKVNVTVNDTDTETVVKQTEDSVSATTKPKPKRVRASTKPKPSKAPEAIQPSTPQDDQDTDVEVVAIKTEDPLENVMSDEEIISSGVDAVVNSGAIPVLGDTNYTIDLGGFSYLAKSQKDNGEYPLGVWVRDPHTLIGFQQAALDRIHNHQGSGGDYAVVDLAEQNAIINDRNMLAMGSRAGADWRNHLLLDNGRKLRNSRANYKTEALTAEEANDDHVLAALLTRLELGVPIVVRCWHSGLVFSINPSDKAAALALVSQLRNAHLDMLRRTTGLIHGTSSYYANRIIINGFMKLVVGSNIDRSLWPSVMELLDHRDIQFMAWGLLASAHPNGYRLIESCGGLKETINADGEKELRPDGTVKKSVCGAKKDGIVDLNLLYQIDNSMFTDWQREFISRPLNGKNTATIEDIRKYQSEGLMHVEDSICIDEEKEVYVLIKAPPANTHIEIGESWVTSVEKALDDAIGINADDETKSEFIEDQIDATSSMDIAHWVTGFVMDGQEYRSRKVINDMFKKIGNNPNMRDDVFEKVRKGMSKRIAAACGIPTARCEECHNLSNTIANNGTAFFTPIDMVSRFFTLTARNQ